MDARRLQELAWEVSRLPRVVRMQFVNAVLSMGELGSEGTELERGGRGRERVDPHGAEVVDQCREWLRRPGEVAGRKGWGQGVVGLMAGVLHGEREGDWEAWFTTPVLNGWIREVSGQEDWEMNVQSLHGMERKGYIKRRPGTHPIQFCFTSLGFRQVKEWAENR